MLSLNFPIRFILCRTKWKLYFLTKNVLVLAVLLICSSSTIAQSDSIDVGFVQTNNVIDSLQSVLENEIDLENRIRTTDRLVNEMVKTDPEAALPIARENLKYGMGSDDKELYGTTMLSMGQVYFRNSMIDSMKYMYESSLPFFREHDLYKLEGSVLRNLGVVSQLNGKLDSTLYYADLCIQHLSVYPDSLTLGSTYFTQASIYDLKGYYKLSTESYLKSLRTYQAIGSNQYVGYVLQGLGHTFLKIGRAEEAMKHSEQALALYKSQENFDQVAQVLNNMGILYKRMGLFEESRKAYHESIRIATDRKLTSLLVLPYHNLMDLEYSDGNTPLALSWANKTDSLASIFGPEQSRGEALRMKALCAIERNDLSAANRFVKQALPYQKIYNDPEHSVTSYKDMGILYNRLGQFENAYASLEQAKIIEDSIFTLEKNAQIEELSLIYETEKKDAKIELLNKESELDDTRKRALWGGIGLLVLLGGGVIYGQYQRRLKEQEVAKKEKEVEIHKRQVAEQQLEFKKKELTAKALQLASKNEFLNTLEEEVAQLSSSVDASVTKTSARISRMIQHDTLDESEWVQFSKEFSSVHQGFVDRLITKYGSFTSGEMRLVSLLKMNLSSKEIANILRVSDEGIKKARYRLRKKLSLDSGDDLSGIILSI